jgi:phenylalanyl-tRNA synthetase alpha chain
VTDGPSTPGPGDLRLDLSPPERALLRALQQHPETLREESDLSEELALPEDTTRGSLQRLRSKQLVLTEEEHVEHRRLTPRGEDALRKGLPERRLLQLLGAAPEGVPPDQLEAQGFDAEERSAAIGRLRRLGLLADGVPLRPREGVELPSSLPEERGLREVHDEVGPSDAIAFASLKKRGLVVVEVETIRRWRPSPEGAALVLAESAVPLLGAVTPELLLSGAWRAGEFRPYDVRANVPFVAAPRPHPYVAWLREFEEILVGLGFEQAEGPLLETEFWNDDVLFMPQEHPARSIHDALSVAAATGHAPAVHLLERVAAAHEGRPLSTGELPLSPGWRYPYDRLVAQRPVLRSQTTAVSARYLARGPKPPFRMYCLDRNFRRDAVDATHHVEFRQCEGLLGGEGVSLRHLVGVFRSLAEAIGIKDVKIRPSYFPFTEPSIEGYVRHPRLGWIEVLPGGMFRPEVLRPLGISVPVAAWGIGVTRLAMVSLGVNDIRELFEDDVQRLAGGAR